MQPHVGESENKAQARVEEFDEKTKKAKNLRARKETKFKKRITTARRMTLLCRGKPNALEIWKWVTRLLELLGTLGMSSEDPEPHYVRMGDKEVRETTHAIKICTWRPQKVTDVLKFVDDAAASSSLKRSTAARSRLRDDKISKLPAPQGLPETLYDEEWMQEGLDMDPEFKDDLRVSDEAFEILEFAVEGLGLQVDDENDDDEM
ncbi:hypothetical protein GGX14DRAFT_579068 [Mycena pura]|uniref:Uncharacterized protein n=1 Tax=Mycena pura TaxID=153505 RepID=A0AAD6UVM8_9AGAR|nr:hypothetical protein GGX14DRAFT_579068 [Mycena pura]